jgi:signal transduction histidine kinase
VLVLQSQLCLSCSFTYTKFYYKLKTYFFYLACYLFFLFPKSLNAQIKITPTDSLESAFNSAKTDTSRLAILMHDEPDMYFGQTEKLLALYQQGLEIATRTQDKKMCYEVTYSIAMTYLYSKSDEGTAFQWLQKTLAFAEENRNFDAVSGVYYAMGIIHDHQGNRPKMFESFLKSIEFDKKARVFDSSPYQGCIMNYTKDNRIEEAIEMGKKAVEQAEKRNAAFKDKLGLCNLLSNALKKAPNQKQALNFYQGKIAALLDSVVLRTKLDFDLDYIAILAGISLDNGKPDLAIKLANRVLDSKGEDNSTLEYHCAANSILADVYEEQKNYPLSIEYLKKSAKQKRALLEKRMTEDSGIKVAKAESERDILVKQKELDGQKWLSILGFSIAALMLLGGVVTFRFYKREQERKQELATINATKDKLFSIIAHDLRSPIGTLKNYLELTNFGMLSQTQFAAASEKLTNNVNALFQTLDNLLQWAYSQLKGIKAKPEILNLHDLVSEELRFLTGIAQHKQIELVNEIRTEASVFADHNQVGLAIRNILSNSLKFTPTGGKIVLNSVYTEGSLRELTITDNGIGMSQIIKNQLFTIEENTSRQGTNAEKGQGLGLILVKDMIEANNGKLVVESAENQGTTVKIQLPIPSKT